MNKLIALTIFLAFILTGASFAQNNSTTMTAVQVQQQKVQQIISSLINAKQNLEATTFENNKHKNKAIFAINQALSEMNFVFKVDK